LTAQEASFRARLVFFSFLKNEFTVFLLSHVKMMSFCTKVLNLFLTLSVLLLKN